MKPVAKFIFPTILLPLLPISCTQNKTNQYTKNTFLENALKEKFNIEFNSAKHPDFTQLLIQNLLFNNINLSVEKYVRDYFINTVKNSSKVDLDYLSFLYTINNPRIDLHFFEDKYYDQHNSYYPENYFKSQKNNLFRITANSKNQEQITNPIKAVSVHEKAKLYYSPYYWQKKHPYNQKIITREYFPPTDHFHRYLEHINNNFANSYSELLIQYLNPFSTWKIPNKPKRDPKQIQTPKFDEQSFKESRYPYKVKNIHIGDGTEYKQLNLEITDVFNEFTEYQLYVNKSEFGFENRVGYELKIVKNIKPMTYDKFIEMLANNRVENATTKKFSFNLGYSITNMYPNYKKWFYVYATDARLLHAIDDFNIINIGKLIEQHNKQTNSNEDIIVFTS